MPAQNDNAQSKGARLHGLDATTDTWEPIGVNSAGEILVTESSQTLKKLSNITQTAVTVTTATTEVTAISNQLTVRFAPVVSGNVYWGPTSAVSPSSFEAFTRETPLNVDFNSSIFLITTATAGVMVSVYRGS